MLKALSGVEVMLAIGVIVASLSRSPLRAARSKSYVLAHTTLPEPIFAVLFHAQYSIITSMYDLVDYFVANISGKPAEDSARSSRIGAWEQLMPRMSFLPYSSKHFEPILKAHRSIAR